ncbi:hypothetical protein JS530_05710 [Bifidobacterium sp. LC6]|uniref:Uncharacterized protein n=2 Tax=Bifidobacterium colobi TaxID=2809026 RepID=A0ABS5UWC5_9BIFI|nr:hypothetical protein [Bifidobacterium colobi]
MTSGQPTGGTPSTTIPHTASQGTYAMPADDRWPIVAQSRDLHGNLVQGRKEAKICLVIGIILGVIFAAMAVIANHTSTHIPTVICGIIGAASLGAIITAFDIAYDNHRRKKLPQTPCYTISARDIQEAYRGLIPIQRLTTSTPIIRHDPLASNDLDYFFHFEVLTNDVGLLCFMPDNRLHRYTLYWSERPCTDSELRKRTFGHYHLGPYGKPTHRSLQSSVRAMRKLAENNGIDLRLRPCTLEIYGTRARLLAIPAAPQLEVGQQDPNIGEQLDGVSMLTDMF